MGTCTSSSICQAEQTSTSADSRTEHDPLNTKYATPVDCIFDHDEHLTIQPRLKNKRMDGNWTRVRSLPTRCKSLHPILLNECEYLIVTTSSSTAIPQLPIIYRYNSRKNRFKTIGRYPRDFPTGYLYTAALDKSTQNLFLWITSYVVVFNVRSKQWTKHSMMHSSDCGGDPCSVAIDRRFHIIGVEEHVIWDEQTCSLEQLSLPFSLEYFDKPSLIHLVEQGKLLLIGQEFGIKSKHRTDSMYLYSLTTRKWNKMKIELPRFLGGCVANKAETELLLFGGQIDKKREPTLDNVYTVNLDLVDRDDDDGRHEVVKSKQKCPKEALYFALFMKNKKEEKLIIHAFIRHCCDMKRLPSMDIVNLISKYYDLLFVHLIDKYNGKQWRINADQI